MGGDWLDRHISQAPAALRDRVRQYALDVPGTSLSHGLAAAGRAALVRVLAHPGDRSAALDLLAADALITLALLAQAQIEPEKLEGFATSVLHSLRPDA